MSLFQHSVETESLVADKPVIAIYLSITKVQWSLGILARRVETRGVHVCF